MRNVDELDKVISENVRKELLGLSKEFLDHNRFNVITAHDMQNQSNDKLNFFTSPEEIRAISSGLVTGWTIINKLIKLLEEEV